MGQGMKSRERESSWPAKIAMVLNSKVLGARRLGLLLIISIPNLFGIAKTHISK